ncbi:hypothetical protein NPS74_23180, partial [Cutibacterium acnes subsp. acnes]|nr:hypothetical protein [Cutibacterium acnes subsp. acnes]
MRAAPEGRGGGERDRRGESQEPTTPGMRQWPHAPLLRLVVVTQDDRDRGVLGVLRGALHHVADPQSLADLLGGSP